MISVIIAVAVSKIRHHSTAHNTMAHDECFDMCKCLCEMWVQTVLMDIRRHKHIIDGPSTPLPHSFFFIRLWPSVKMYNILDIRYYRYFLMAFTIFSNVLRLMEISGLVGGKYVTRAYYLTHYSWFTLFHNHSITSNWGHYLLFYVGLI